MLRSAKKLTERDLESQFQKTLRELVERVQFLKLASLKQYAKLGNDRIGRPDWVAELRTGDQSWTLVAEGKKNGQPREVRAAVFQLKHYISLLPPGKPSYGLVIAPFISEESARICTDAGVGYADFAGNARLSFDRIFIETRSATHPPGVKREAKSVFSPKATRVIRVLLQGPLRAWRVKDLAAAAEVSLGHVSTVRQQLLAREWAVEEEGGLRVIKANELLDAWAVVDDWSKRTEVRDYSLLENDAAKIAAALGKLLVKQSVSGVFTQWFAALLRAPYTIPPVVSAYVSRFPDEGLLRQELGARRVAPGAGRLRLVLPSDFRGIADGSRNIGDFHVVSDVQIYLDLLGSGQRADEQAEELRKAEDFAGGWK